VGDKVTVHDGDAAYLAKFTRADDPFNHARVEHVCLELARRAGLEAPISRIVQLGRFDALLVSRFDVTTKGGRYHLVSANALLKVRRTQADRAMATYKDLVRLIRRYSEHPVDDLQQLFALMLLNEVINNLDDHLRNFSFRHGPNGFRLTPAYDLVPAAERGGYPNLGFDHQPMRPPPQRDNAHRAGAQFQLRPREVDAVMQRLVEAYDTLPQILD
jgi:serine/threonine-protein kinase HipA